MANWQPIASAPNDGTMVQVFCPGISSPTRGVLQGCWSDNYQVWILNPYGTVQFTSLFPTYWAPIDTPPA